MGGFAPFVCNLINVKLIPILTLEEGQCVIKDKIHMNFQAPYIQMQDCTSKGANKEILLARKK